MRVLVTGGTGFVGSHTVAALVDKGHEVRLLVRSPDRIAPALGPLGVQDVGWSTGDVTDPASVRDAMDGCEAVLHAASVYSLDPRAAGRIRRTNVPGTRIVLATAREMGLDPVVHVSSIVALTPPHGEILSTETSVKSPPGTYFRSKADSERVARRFQAEGAPVVITHPGAVWGPCDPNWGDGPQLVRDILKGRLPMISKGGFPIVDVRDLANVHAAVMEPGRGPRRYMVGGTYLPFGEAIRMLAELTGRKLPFVTLPWWSLAPIAGLVHVLQPILHMRVPVSLEGVYMLRWDVHCNDLETKRETGVDYADLRETMADMVRWMHRTGGISTSEAGTLAGG